MNTQSIQSNFIHASTKLPIQMRNMLVKCSRKNDNLCIVFLIILFSRSATAAPGNGSLQHKKKKQKKNTCYIVCRLRRWGCQNIWPERKFQMLRCTVKADRCILQHHPCGSMSSQRASPGDWFQISSQCFGQGYHLNINPSTFPGYRGYGGEEYPEKSYTDIYANSAKKGQTSTLGYKPWACLPTVFYHWTHFNAMQLMSHHNQGRNNENIQNDEEHNLCLCRLVLWQGVQKSHTSNKEKGDIWRHVKVT